MNFVKATRAILPKLPAINLNETRNLSQSSQIALLSNCFVITEDFLKDFLEPKFVCSSLNLTSPFTLSCTYLYTCSFLDKFFFYLNHDKKKVRNHHALLCKLILYLNKLKIVIT